MIFKMNKVGTVKKVRWRIQRDGMRMRDEIGTQVRSLITYTRLQATILLLLK